ncbi:uncharacterized protein C8A04DRAFT_23883 [Dichotomopilus funicola]|uniref:Telomeric single stranded DNA binding POT1/Cdc13 domain-containing protein n=1 Tax=Dichotomopilus funicola TaxID=1934379 RepID=A0AAN6VB73_9PEZI|nr:hypothetical protein C8A04DRAFT_23883 [Dichotomopilus funicola]
MAAANGDGASDLSSRAATPIAQLSPDLADQASRVVRGEVTITWPYNSVTKRFAFLIAEPDVRLRRARGQIRVELQGPSATAAAESGLGAGDELVFSLAGVEWAKDASPGRIPGARVEWQLQFSCRIDLQVKFGESGEVKLINIDNPAEQQPDGLGNETPRLTSIEPEPAPVISEVPTTTRKLSDFTANEYPSPAFVKRARISYGALFEGGFDLFEEDGGVKGKGRKRTRFGRDSSAWRYTSQSPSPEPSPTPEDAMDEDEPEDINSQPSPLPPRRNWGSQNFDVDAPRAAAEPVNIALERDTAPAAPAPSTPLPQRLSANPVPRDSSPAPRISTPAVEPESRHEQSNEAQISQPEATAPVTDLAFTIGPHEESTGVLHGEEQREQPVTIPSQQAPPPDLGAVTRSDTLFSSNTFSDSFSAFGAGASDQVESNLSLADQVRFGFSHVPQTSYSPTPPVPKHVPEPAYGPQELYPTAYLDASAPPKFADMGTYVDAADEQPEVAQTQAPEPPTVQQFGGRQWEMSTESPHYNPVEGGHFGSDALNEGTRIEVEQPSLHADDIAPEQVPEGFASYGQKSLPEDGQENPTPPAPPPTSDEPVAEEVNSDSEEEVGVQEEEDVDSEADEYEYGERIEEGDYDQRKYDILSDDDEGLSEEEDEVELETEERYGNEEVYDEDGEGEEWDEGEEYGSEEGEDEEGNEEEEEDEESEDEEEEGEDGSEGFDVSRYQPRRQAPPTQTGPPEVISLLSDSEDEEEEPKPPPPPPKRSSPPQAQTTIQTLFRTTSPTPQPTQTESQTVSRKGTPPQTLMSSEPSQATISTHRETIGAVEETEQNDVAADDEHRIFGQTHVVDFATVAPQQSSVQAKAAVVDLLDTSTDNSSVISLASSSFETSSVRDETPTPKKQHAPSEVLPDPIVASEQRSQSTPSESSSEGLFISKPRARSPGTEGELPSVSSTKEFCRTDNESAREYPSAHELGHDGIQDGLESVGEREQGATSSPLRDAQHDDSSLPDADTLSLASQVEAPEEFGNGDDGHMSVDEEGEASAGEYDVMVVSEDDVDMIDASSARVESASPDKIMTSPQRDNQEESTPSIADPMVTDDMSQTAASHSADESLPDAQTPTQEEERLTPVATDEGPVTAADEMMEVVSDTEPTPVLVKPRVDLAVEEVVESTQQSTTMRLTEEVDTIPRGLPQEVDENIGVNETAAAAAATVVSLEAGGIVEVEASSAPVRSPRSPWLDGTVDDNASSVPFSQDNQQQNEKLSELEEFSSQEELGGVEQPMMHDAEQDLEDETLILEQLTQEQQQSFRFESVVSDEGDRSSSPNPDLSVDLARQAIAFQSDGTSVELESKDKSDYVDQLGDREDNEHVDEPQSPDLSVQLARDASTPKLRPATADLASSEKNEKPEISGRFSTPDLSVQLARQSVGSKRNKKAAAEPVRTSARITRARSSSFRSNTTNGTPEKDKEDPSISFARSALASPSKRPEAEPTDPSTSFTSTTSTGPTTAAALKADLTKRLRSELPGGVALKALRNHPDKFLDTIVVVTSRPTQPTRAHGGPREFFMSFRATDPSAAPGAVIEVQMYRPHKDSLPVVAPGDVVLLQRFQVKAMTKKEWGLRTGMESAWAVWEGGGHHSLDKPDEAGATSQGAAAPQIRGPPVEDWERYVGYVATMKEWFALVVGDETSRKKLEKADQKMAEAK